MNYSLAREIYGGECWAIQPAMVDPLLNSLQLPSDKAEKFNSFVIRMLNGTVVSTDGGKSSNKNQASISVTNINGVVIKNGGASSRGTKELGADLLTADANPDVIGHLFIIDSPGGSVNGMNYMKSIMGQLTKPKVGIVEQSGMAASAGYAILSQCDYVMAESDDAEVGCIGIINRVIGHKNGSTDADNATHYIVYSDGSEDKNKAARMAINEDDISLLVAEATAEKVKFHAMVKDKRSTILDSQLTGAMYPASEVVGTMVDAVGSSTDAVNKILELSNAKINFSTNLNKTKNKTMTKAQLLSEHPELHAEIFGAGVQAEKERVDTWMVFHDIDPVAVQTGIESGKDVSKKEMAAFNLKAASSGALNALKRDSQGNIIPPETETETETRTAQQKIDQAEYDAAFPRQKGKVDLAKVQFKSVLSN